MTSSRSSRSTPSRTSQVSDALLCCRKRGFDCETDPAAVWTVQAEAEKERARQASAEAVRLAEEAKTRRDAIRREAGLPAQSGVSESGSR